MGGEWELDCMFQSMFDTNCAPKLNIQHQNVDRPKKTRFSSFVPLLFQFLTKTGTKLESNSTFGPVLVKTGTKVEQNWN